MTTQRQRETLIQLLDTAVAAANPLLCVPPALPEPPENGKLIILGAGKGSAAMVRAAEQHYLDRDIPVTLTGCAVTRTGFALPTRAIEMIEAGHPVPDEAGARAAARALEIAQGAEANDLILILISGGASALWSAPVDGVTLEEKQQLTRALLASGAPINEINCVRKHLSKIKGGELGRAAAPARVITLAISDVPGDAPTAIGSGPSVGDPTSLSDAKHILQKRNVELLPSIAAALETSDNETPLPDDPVFVGNEYILVSRPADALHAAAKSAERLGYKVQMLGDALEGEAREVARKHGELALACKALGERTALMSGGEFTVTVTGKGKGGPNQEYALALAETLGGAENISALSADTDGIDGGEGAQSDPAGAIVDPTTISRAEKHGLNPAKFLQNNDSTGFFGILGDLVIIGPTGTNVNDFRVILVDC